MIDADRLEIRSGRSGVSASGDNSRKSGRRLATAQRTYLENR